MGSESRRGGFVIAAVVAVIAVAGLAGTFGSGLAAATESARERVSLMFMSDEEEASRALEEYDRAWNYEGSSGEEMRAQISPTVAASFWDSEGGQSVRAWVETLEQNEEVFVHRDRIIGTRTVEEGEDHRLLEVTFDNTVFIKDDGERGDLLETETRRRIRVVRTDGRWLVGWAGESERLSERKGA